jgi:hypothetical protein
LERDGHRQYPLLQLVGVLCLLACSLTTNPPPATPLPALGAITQVGVSTATPTFAVIDVSWALDEVCFEALLSLDGQRLVFLDDVALGTFYNLLDNYCDEPAPRPAFDFSTQIIMLAVEVTQGCTAELTPISLDASSVTLQYSANGSCQYELVTVYMVALAHPAGAFEVRVIGA